MMIVLNCHIHCHSELMQLKTKVDEVINLTSVHGALKAQFEKRVADLEDRCAKLSHANKQLEVRR